MSENNNAFEGWAILEEWRSVVGYEGLYQVSDEGRVRRGGRVLKRQHTANGYPVVQLWRDGEPKTCLVHRVVAEAFIGTVPDGKEVNHRDGDKENATPSNLEYVTRSENSIHAYKTGLRLPTVDQMVDARRKPRVTVPCACDCGAQLETPDRKGRDRRYITGHNMRRTS